jgi:hypothetical protein
LSPQERLRIIAKAEGGVSVAELVDEFQRSPNCIRTTIRLAKNRTTTLEAPRSGRPPILLLHPKNIIYRKARAAPKIKYLELAQVGVFVNAEGTPSKPPSRSTLYRYLKGQGLTVKSVQNSTAGMLQSACISAGSTETLSGVGARSSSQMSALFRRAQATT